MATAKLTPEQILDGWYQFSAGKLGYKKSKAVWLEERNRAQTDLFWLAKSLLKLDLVDSFVCPTHPIMMGPEPKPCPLCNQTFEPCPGIPPGISVHRQICDTFVHKNPNETIYNQDTKKTRIILCPRGSFKSSIDMADVAQWVVCFPNIRVLIFSASPDLGVNFVTQVKNWFRLAMADEKADTYGCNKEFEHFQQLFAEHLLKPTTKESEDRFTTPARTKAAFDPTVFTLPLEGSTSGHHADVGKFDDCVSDSNSGPKSTVENRQKVGENIRLKRKLILLNGYVDHVGTPYSEDDAHAHTIQYRKPEVILIRPAWEVKASSKAKKKTELTKDDYYLLLPIDGKGEPQLTYESLKKEEDDDSFLFACQYLCSPTKDSHVVFTEDMILSHVIASEGLPQPGQYKIFSSWDLAASTGRNSDYSVGVVGFITLAGPLIGRIFIREVIRGRFSKYELPYQIAFQAAKWRVERIGIEKSPGADFLENEIMRQLNVCGYADCQVPEWFLVDTQKDAKEARAEDLSTLLMQDRLYFSSEIPIMEDVIKEFVRFKPHTRRKDDIVDAIAQLTRYLPSHIELPKNEQERQKHAYDWLKQKQLHEMLYPEQPPPASEPVAAPAPTSYEGYPLSQGFDIDVYGT